MKKFTSWLKPHAKLATVAGVVVIAGGSAVATTCTCVVPTFGGGGGGSGTANIWIDSNGGTCARSATLVAYSDAAACSTPQAAYNATSCGDEVGVEAGTYTNWHIISNGSSCSSNVTFRPDGGTVIIKGSTSGDPHALTLGDESKCFECGLDPPNHITFDGGTSKEFQFGVPGVQGAAGRMGQIKVYAAYGSCCVDQVVADHIRLTNLHVCNACPDNGNGTVEFGGSTNFELSNSIIGPVCCGLDQNNNPAASPTELPIGPRAGFPNPNHGLIQGNVFAGETRCGETDAATSCTPGMWPIADLGAAPQDNCNTSCHADAVHDEGDDDTSYINNVFLNAQAQGIYLEGGTNPYMSNMTLIGNQVDSLSACGICSGATVVRGHWVIALNTVYPGIGFADPHIGSCQTCTALAANFVIPAVNSNVTIQVASSTGFAANQHINTEDNMGNFGYFKVASVPNSTHITITNLNDCSCNDAPGTTITTGNNTVYMVWEAGASVTIMGNISKAANTDIDLNGAGCGEGAGNVLTYSYNYYPRNPGDDATTTCGTGDQVMGPSDWLVWSDILVHRGDWNESPPDNATDFDTDFGQAGNLASNLVPAATCRLYQTTDLHGTTRPAAGFCDAGSDEST